jgi:hypothetical protein
MRISAFTDIEDWSSLAKVTRYGPPKRIKPSSSLSKNMERTGNSSRKCLAPKMASRFARDTLINWTLVSKDRIGLRKRIGKSCSFSAILAASGLKSAKVCRAALRIKSKIAFTPTSRRTMILNLRNFRTFTHRTSKYKKSDGEILSPSLSKQSLQSDHIISLKQKRTIDYLKNAFTPNYKFLPFTKLTFR